MAITQTRPTTGLGRLGTAVLLILLLVGSAFLMHTLAGHTGAHAASAAEHTHTSDAAHTSEAVAAPSLTAAAQDDCGGLCAMLCTLMGMACLMVLVLFAWAVLRRRGSRALFVLSKALGALPAFPTITVPRLTPGLAQLSILRV